ncbi:hypothetical protein AB205_0117810 [Aquarana catesbeiana]|uniref:Uncharacterized protein n=1 Tax=Aquarana catesbeiana TaxID=8400 RepID=A0A2G9Q2T7_AQUCT|nr:hypothetical protein AB205_0117810 [Aquarana catesbeiana]
MFPIYSSAIKSLCAKYSIFFFDMGRKHSEDTPHPRRTQTPTSGRRENPTIPRSAGGGRRRGGTSHHNR